MNPYKPVQGDHAKVVGGFDEETVFAPNEQFVQDLFTAYDRACFYHIRSATMAVSDKGMEKQAAFDLGVKEGMRAALQLIPYTCLKESDDLSSYDLDALLERMQYSRNDFES